MQNIKDVLGGLFGLGLIGSIIYLNAKDGEFLPLQILGGILLIIFLISAVQKNKKNNRDKEKQRITDFNKNKELEKRRRIERIENMSEDEFISFVKYNRNDLDKHFKKYGVIGLGHGNESKQWESSKYVIISTIDDNDFNESINIYRKSNKEKIFSGMWGFDFDC